MANEDILLRLKLLDEFSSTLKKYQDELSKTERQTRTEVASMTGGYDKLKTAIAAIGASAAFAAIVQGFRSVVNAAAEAEAAQTKLVASLKATGRYSEEAVAGIEKWASSLMGSIGVTDELAKSLVAEGLAMGKNVEQSQRLIEAAANMAPIVGSLEGAFSMLERASNGSMASLKRYGVAVTEAEMKSGDFEAVLQRIEKQFSGQASAAMNTYNGRLKEAKDAWSELSETIGLSFLPVLTNALESWRDFVNEYLRGISVMDRANAQMAGNNPLMKAAQDYQAAAAEFERTKQVFLSGSAFANDPAQMIAAGEKMRKALEELRRLQREMADGSGAAAANKSKATFAPVKELKDSGEAAKALKEELARMAAEQEAAIKNLGNAERARFDAQKQGLGAIETANAVILGGYMAQEAAIRRLIALDAERQATLDPSDRQRMDWQKDGGTKNENLAAAAAGAVQGTATAIQNMIRDYENALKALGAGTGDIERMRDQKNAESDAAVRNAVAAGRSASALEKHALSAEMASLALQGIGAIIGTALRGGNVGSAVAGVGGQLAGAYIGDALKGTLGKTLAPVVGGVVGDLIGAGLSSILGGNEPRTVGGKGRKALDDILGDAGLRGRWNEETKANVTATGQWEMWDQLAKLLVGDKVGGGAAKLYDALDDLGMSFGDNLQAVSYLVASTKDLSDAEADLAVAQAAIFSSATMGLEDLTAAADMWADATDRIARKAELEKKIMDDLEAYRGAKKTAGAADDNVALRALEQDRSEYIALMRADLEAKKAWEEKLREEGVTAAEQAKATKGIEGTNKWLELIYGAVSGDQEVPTQHAGRMVGGHASHKYWVRDDEDIIPPEKRMTYARDILRGSGGGGATIVVNVSGAVGDHRDVAKKLHRELKRLREFGEVSN